MWGKVISVPDILKEEQLNILNSFQNEHYLEAPEMIELKIPFSKKAYQMPMSALLSFIGLSEKHIIQAIEYFKKEIFEKYPWLEDIVSLGLQEIFYDIQAAVIKKNAEYYADNNKLYTNCFIVHSYVSDAFLQLKIIEQGIEFQYAEYNEKIIELNKKTKNDKTYLDQYSTLSPTPETYLIDHEGKFMRKFSGGLGLAIIDGLSDGDYTIGNIELNSGFYGKLILFRIENKEHIAYNAFSKEVLNAIKIYQNKLIAVSETKKYPSVIYNIGLTNEHRRKFEMVFKNELCFSPWQNKDSQRIMDYFNLFLINVQRSAIQNAYNNFYLRKMNIFLPFVTVAFVDLADRFQIQIVENNNLFFLYKHIHELNSMLQNNLIKSEHFEFEEKKFYLKELEILYEKDRLVSYFDPDLARMIDEFDRNKEVNNKTFLITHITKRKGRPVKEIVGKIHLLEKYKN